MTAFAYTRRSQNGFSLTEMMVAMLIGLIILAAAIQMFVSTNKASNNQDRLARTQENGRFAMFYLLRDLRMAGYMGCMRDVETNLTNDLATPVNFYSDTASLAIPIEGIDDATSGSAWAPSGSTTMPASLWTAGTTAKPDLIVIRGVDTLSRLPVTTLMTSLASALTVTSTSGYTNTSVVLVGDCLKSDLVQVTVPSSTQLTPTVSLSKQYDTNASVYRYSTRTYYIRLNNNGVPSLYRDENGGSTVELVEGIESIKILYGIATPPNVQPSYYRKAGAMSATEWGNVASVKIGILARTPNTKDTDIDNNTYNVNGTVLGPFGDRNVRRVFTATALLKNQVLP
jgi:type IV pilus assembly protein PilW